MLHGFDRQQIIIISINLAYLGMSLLSFPGNAICSVMLLSKIVLKFADMDADKVHYMVAPFCLLFTSYRIMQLVYQNSTYI